MQTERDRAALVSTSAGVPLHRQLFLVLHDEIGRGALAAGDALPTEQSLCDQFGVSRITVRRALADLVDAGLIERRHGVGSFVTKQSPPSRAGLNGSYLDEMRQVEFETEVDVVEFGISALPGIVAARLDCGDRGLHVVRLRRGRLTGQPLMVTEAWLPEELAEVITEDALASAPLHRLLADAGVVLERLEHEVTAEIAGPRIAGLLGTAIGSPVIRMNRVAFVDALPHHYWSIVLSPNRSRIVVQQNLESGVSSGLAIAHDVRRPTV
ncbi:GntR family transcriptional regulator [Mycolicibacterium sp.]|uniref:GntR family transcriptional regulator n=1 Tax=Mycolicibacterium sp. TaxID=2320850 RepID=UPI001A1C8263|nr:GntR family transcriptional regulator [Mycolicibacterium sp.]MBJ7338908.1 GntR family transcriptional regulator [Mycolicibacterium sp.]